MLLFGESTHTGQERGQTEFLIKIIKTIYSEMRNNLPQLFHLFILFIFLVVIHIISANTANQQNRIKLNSDNN